ncbi:MULTISPECIES: peroxiredoxin-like family protein [Rhodopseudomonas]|uniref:thioredoxin-dependent peroxiredoxin n=1 Tax=Rhodopseudomonas palustris TaxID=1076 RepID=A0A0D7F4K9_RHOPL|nr:MULTISPECIES: peroxiredoxin-like family protein [Rhodopseudomonas]KIZ48028.1 alkyl hydroperoxide reductase [Rhodopseudomonas palustris]MDF3811903.1 peroxiredoxin-like family protein [Rhodopseudomonas sp. BAL398]WOK16667.1 peroxiredoxin-like family protein [Rhodopseudomonas sp. BAL398]
MSLQAELTAFHADFIHKVPAEMAAAMTQADLNLSASGILDRASKAGDRAPLFTLPNSRDGATSLAEALTAGPVVLSFYRGGWCPYCNLELRALQKALPDFTALGASLIAVSPQTPDQSLSTVERNDLAFAVLSDTGSAAAKAYGIAFDLAEELHLIYAKLGQASPDRNGDGGWVLPLPATYVIDRDGIIAFAYVDVDFRNRLEPATITATLAALARRTWLR